MEKTKKMTKAQMFAQIKANYPLTTAEVEFIDHELALLAKKNSAEKKPTAQQKENVALCEQIMQSMEPNRLYTIGEMIKEFPVCAGLSTSKVSSMLRQLKEMGKVKRTEDKRKAYFSLV